MQVDCARTRRPLIITIYEAKSKLCGHRFRWWQPLPIGCICPCVKLCPCCKVHTQQACLSCHRSKDRWGQPTTSYAKWFRLQCIGDGCLGRLICNIVSEDFARNFSSFRFEKSLRSVRDFTVATERKLLQVKWWHVYISHAGYLWCSLCFPPGSLIHLLCRRDELTKQQFLLARAQLLTWS